MRKSAFLLLLPVLVAAAPLLADETLPTTPPEGFVLAREAVDPMGTRSMYEHVPAGQSVWDWTTKVMIQTVPKMRAPAGYTASVARTFEGNCDGAQVATLLEGEEGGHAVSMIQAACPATKSDGAPAAFLMKAIDGAETTYVVEWAWQGALPDAAQIDEARRFLEGRVLCDDATGSCPSS